MSDDAFRIAIVLALGIIAISLYVLAGTMVAAWSTRIDYRKHDA
jgi:hypothetical protein